MYLKKGNRYLYRRVKLKVVVHLVFGVILVFFPAQSYSLPKTPLLNLFGVASFGLMYIAVGLFIYLGLLRSSHDYSLARTAIFIAAAFNTMILFSLFSVFFQNKTTAFFIAMYWYFTQSIWYVFFDPGWKAVGIAKGIIENVRDNTSD